MPDFRCTYRLQLSAELRLPRGARGRRAVPARARGLAPLPLAVAAGAARLDARLRRRRPDAASPRTSAARTSSARSARRRATPASASILDIVPNHMATSDEENPFWADPELRAPLLRLGSRDRLVPALLRRRRARRRPRRGSRGLRDDAREGARARRATASSTGSASTIPTGSRTRASTSSGCAGAASAHVWVEKILEPGEQLRDWPVEGTTGYEFANDVDRALRRPRRRGAAHRAVRGADRRAPHVRRSRARGEARGGAHDVRAGVRPAARALPARRARGRRRRAARLPHLRRARGRAASRRTTGGAECRLPDDLRRVVLLEASARRRSTSSSCAGSRPPGR